MKRLWSIFVVGLLAGVSSAFVVHAAGSVIVDKEQSFEAPKITERQVVADMVARTEAAWKASPNDIKKQYAYALVAPCSVSVALFTAIAGNSRAPDSLLAEAYRQLGDYSFVYSAFKTAAEKYAKALSVVAKPEYRYLRAKALLALGDSAVIGCIDTLLMDNNGDLSNKARYLKAQHYMHRSRFDSAFSVLAFTRTIDSTKPYYASALAAKLECALRIGKADDVAALKNALAPWEGRLLEMGRLNQLSSGVTSQKALRVASEKSLRNESATVEGVVENATFTLQVGAFGSLENATVLQKKMEALFHDVSVLPVSMAESVIYRVRVGSFKSTYEAEAFGNDSLTSAGVQFRVVAR